MKKILTLLLITVILHSCRTTNELSTVVMVPRSTQVSKVLDDFTREESKFMDLKNCFVYFRTNKLGDEIRIGAVEKEITLMFLKETNDKLVGTFEKDGIDFLIFGKKANKYFYPRNTRMNTTYSKYNQIITKSKRESEVDIVFSIEPIVWIYKNERDSIKFVEKGRLILID